MLVVVNMVNTVLQQRLHLVRINVNKAIINGTVRTGDLNEEASLQRHRVLVQDNFPSMDLRTTDGAQNVTANVAQEPEAEEKAGAV